MRPLEQSAFICTHYSVISKASCLVPPMFFPVNLHTHTRTHAHVSAVLCFERATYRLSSLKMFRAVRERKICRELPPARSRQQVFTPYKESSLQKKWHPAWFTSTDPHFTGITATHEACWYSSTLWPLLRHLPELNTQHQQGGGKLAHPCARCMQVPRHVGASISSPFSSVEEALLAHAAAQVLA